eukprot:scaffold84390_cov36-Attheya_sp.AAC.1
MGRMAGSRMQRRVITTMVIWTVLGTACRAFSTIRPAHVKTFFSSQQNHILTQSQDSSNYSTRTGVTTLWGTIMTDETEESSSEETITIATRKNIDDNDEHDDGKTQKWFQDVWSFFQKIKHNSHEKKEDNNNARLLDWLKDVLKKMGSIRNYSKTDSQSIHISGGDDKGKQLHISESSNIVSESEDGIVVTATTDKHIVFQSVEEHQLLPEGSRWATSFNRTDLSGKWKPIVTPEFKLTYDAYLKNCSQPMWFRNLCLNFVGTTREEIVQNGTQLVIRGTNPGGVWTRTLVSSGSDIHNATFEPIIVEFPDPDKEMVQVESWWMNEGTWHKSWMRGKKRIKGGEFESTRYLESPEVL